MRKATENQGNTRTLTEYFSLKNKGKDLTFRQHLQPNMSSFHQETPMKPSQVPNRLSLTLPKRVLPLHSPEQRHRDRLGPPLHPSHTLGPIHSSVFVPHSPPSTCNPVSRLHHTPRSRSGPPLFSAQPQFVPVNPTKIDVLANRPQDSPLYVFHPNSSQMMKDLSNYSPSTHIRRDQVTNSRVTLSYSGIKSSISQDLNKAQSSDAKTARTVQLHRPPVTPSDPRLNSTTAQQLYPLHHLDSEQCSPSFNQWALQGCHPSPTIQSSDTRSGVLMQSPVAPCQDQTHKGTTSVVDLNCSSQKRQRTFDDRDSIAKKLCVDGANSGKEHTPKPTAGNSLITSQVLSSRDSPVLELSQRTTENHLCKEPPSAQTACLEVSSILKHSQSSLSPISSVKIRPAMGTKQVFLKSSQDRILKLRSPPKHVEESLSQSQENAKRDKSSIMLSPDFSKKDTSTSSYILLGSHHSGHTHCNTPVAPVKTRDKQVEESGKFKTSNAKPAFKQTSGSVSCPAVKRKKTGSRRPVIKLNDEDELFTPDPMTYIVSSVPKTAKPNVERETLKLPTSEKSCSSTTATTSSSQVSGSSCDKIPTTTVTGSTPLVDAKVSSATLKPQVFLPTVALVRANPALESTEQFNSKDGNFKNGPITSLVRKLKEKSIKSEEKRISHLPNNVCSHTIEPDTAASKQMSASCCSQSPPLKRQASEGARKQIHDDDPIDVELGFSFALDLDLTQSSHSSEEEQLLSLQEMMQRVTKPPDTPEKGAYSEPSTPGQRSCQSTFQPLPSTTKSENYKNSLDQMLKEINTNKKAKEIETQLLTACKEDLLRIAEYEAAEENKEEGISTEQQEFLQRYSLMSNAIREVPPGEVVFSLEKFGQIFNQDTLQLRQCMVSPQTTAQKTLLWSSPAQLRLHVTIGLFQEAYECSPCPTQVTRFLFKMMSVHSERMVSEMMLQALCDIACSAAYQRVKNGNQQFKVWVPSLADVTLVLMNMGAAFVTLFPFENLQPAFTEGDLLEDEHVKIESPSVNRELDLFPEHNCNNMLEYLSYCMGLCPRAYSDRELLLLLTVVGRIGMDTRLVLQSSVKMYPLQYKIINNMRDWDTMLPRICQVFTDLTDDHHNMCLLVQMLPDNTRGKQLRPHLSLSMISKLLDGRCTYRPTETDFQLSKLRPYLPRMQPSALVRALLNTSSRTQNDKEEDMATLDQQAYYLCYSLLTLANEASNFQFFPAQQKEHLLSLCFELETHVKCDIRESEKCLYRSKVKDLVARIYTKWQMLLQRTRPLNGKLYDYWQPLTADKVTSSQEEQTMEYSDDGEGAVIGQDSEIQEDDEEEKETSASEENEILVIDEDEEQKEEERLEANEHMGLTEKLEKERNISVDDPNETERKDGVPGVLNLEMPATEPEVYRECEAADEEMDGGNTEHTENVVDAGLATSHHNPVATCDVVS